MKESSLFPITSNLAAHLMIPLILMACFHFVATADEPQNCFFPESRFVTFDRVGCLASGDINQDGKMDLVAATFAREIEILFGSGTGRFESAGVLDSGSFPSDLAVEDFNGDQLLDIIAVGRETILIYLGNGDGTFQPGTFLKALDEPDLLVVGDFDSDGDLDFVVTSIEPNPGLTIFENDSQGNFVATGNMPFDANSFGIAAGDLNGDGAIDLAITFASEEMVSVLLGTGDGNFGPAVPLTAEGLPRAIAFADLDDDGDEDMLVATRINNQGFIIVYDNDGLGMFQQALLSSAGSIREISLVDLNGDSALDIVVSNESSGFGFAVHLGDGTLNFGQPVNYLNRGASEIETVDFDGDGDVDVAAASVTSDFEYITLNLGNGDGTFPEINGFSTGQFVTNITKADLNNDAVDDVITVNLSAQSLSIFLGNPDGSLTQLGEIEAGVFPFFAETADVDNDGYVDLVVANRFGAAISILLGNGDGTFGPSVSIAAPTGPSAIKAIDLNGDECVDLVVASPFVNEVSIYHGRGDGTFDFVESYEVLQGPAFLECGDFDSDGVMDLAIANDVSDTVAILRGSADGSFEPGAEYAIEREIRDFQVADLNRDGVIDLAVLVNQVGSTNDGYVILIADAMGEFKQQELVNVEFDPASMAIGDVNADSIPDLVLTLDNQLEVRYGVGDGSFHDFAFFGSRGSSLVPLVLGDFDGDLDLDVAAGGVTLMLNHCSAVGDVNKDGTIDLLDVEGFVERLTVGQFQFEADVNRDGVVDLLDIGPFVDLLSQ